MQTRRCMPGDLARATPTGSAFNFPPTPLSLSQTQCRQRGTTAAGRWGGGIVGVPPEAAGRLPKSLYMALLSHEKSLWRPMSRDTHELAQHLYESIRSR